MEIIQAMFFFSLIKLTFYHLQLKLFHLLSLPFIIQIQSLSN